MSVEALADAVRKQLARLSAAGVVSSSEVRGCTSGEIDQLETRLGRHLPPAYRAFLSVMGGAAGSFPDAGRTAFYLPDLLELATWAPALLERCGVEPGVLDGACVFYVHDGYSFAYFNCGEAEDPEVMTYAEGMPAPVHTRHSYLEFLARLVDAHVEGASEGRASEVRRRTNA
jgi:SMI1/KNR4 family protein SUKH-1